MILCCGGGTVARIGRIWIKASCDLQGTWVDVAEAISGAVPINLRSIAGQSLSLATDCAC